MVMLRWSEDVTVPDGGPTPSTRETRMITLGRTTVVVFFTLLLFLSSGACGGSGEEASQGASPPAQYQAGTWLEGGFDAALATAGELGRPVVMDLYADWCGPCRTLGEEYFTSSEMQPVLEKAVLLRMDVDTPEGGRVAGDFGVNAIPAVIVLLPDGAEVDRIVGVAGSISDYGAQLDGIIEEALGRIGS